MANARAQTRPKNPPQADSRVQLRVPQAPRFSGRLDEVEGRQQASRFSGRLDEVQEKQQVPELWKPGSPPKASPAKSRPKAAPSTAVAGGTPEAALVTLGSLQAAVDSPASASSPPATATGAWTDASPTLPLADAVNPGDASELPLGSPPAKAKGKGRGKAAKAGIARGTSPSKAATAGDTSEPSLANRGLWPWPNGPETAGTAPVSPEPLQSGQDVSPASPLADAGIAGDGSETPSGSPPAAKATAKSAKAGKARGTSPSKAAKAVGASEAKLASPGKLPAGAAEAEAKGTPSVSSEPLKSGQDSAPPPKATDGGLDRQAAAAPKGSPKKTALQAKEGSTERKSALQEKDGSPEREAQNVSPVGKPKPPIPHFKRSSRSESPPKITKQDREEQDKENARMLRVCSRIRKAAIFSTGGKDWAQLFREQRKDDSDVLTWDEFYNMCIWELKLTDQRTELREIFNLLAEGSPGQMSIDRLIDVVQSKAKEAEAVRRSKAAAKLAIQREAEGQRPSWNQRVINTAMHNDGVSNNSRSYFSKFSPLNRDTTYIAGQSVALLSQVAGCHEDERQEQDVVLRIISRIKSAAYTSGGKDWEKLFREQDKDKSGEMCWSEFYSMCRRVLHLTDQDAALRKVFKLLDADGSGEVSLEELVAMVKDPPVKASSGAPPKPRWVEASHDKALVNNDLTKHTRNYFLDFDTKPIREKMRAQHMRRVKTVDPTTTLRRNRWRSKGADDSNEDDQNEKLGVDVALTNTFSEGAALNKAEHP